MNKFPSIEQFRSAIHQVKTNTTFAGKNADGEPIYDYSRRLPTINYRGSVKLHGTNASIVMKPDGEFICQSRERVLSYEEDNAGFFKWADDLDLYESLFKNILYDLYIKNAEYDITVYGEWCGKGIQKGVAISELERMFVVFAIKYDDVWVTDILNLIEDKEARIFDIRSFPQYEMTIDFNQPELAQNQLIRLTEEVEAKCPVGDAFSVEGIGEGIVWQPIEDEWNSSKYWFKTKGEKHSSSKVKTLVPVDIETMKAVTDFIEYAVTESRLEQGLHNLVNEQMKPFAIESMGDFIRWVNNDIFKEESDTIEANGFDRKKLGGPIAKAARSWYGSKLNDV